MAVTELERTELASRLVSAIGPEATETLMKCIIPEGRDQLATKDDLRLLRTDLKLLSTELRGEMAELRSQMEVQGAELRGFVHSEFARHTRLIMTTMVGFMLTIWITLLVPAVI